LGADIVTLVDVATDLVVTVKVALALPADIITLAGTVAAAVLLLDSDNETDKAVARSG
jgi:hypothetical protein